MVKRIHITESKLCNLIHEAVVSEISKQSKAGSFVKANNDISRLNKMKQNGERTFTKNGRRFDIDNEISRRHRQMDTFGDGLGRDLKSEYGSNSGKDYKVSALDGDGYAIDTPKGRAYSNSNRSNIVYLDNSPSNVNRLSKLQDITNAMMGYDDELNGRMDKKIDGIRRRQSNVQSLRDYEDALNQWSRNDNEIKKAQNAYDRMSPLNPKKWFTKRPTDGPKKPLRPEWKPNENGEFDGYFAHTNPNDYDKDIDDVRKLQNTYRDSRDRFFRK